MRARSVGLRKVVDLLDRQLRDLLHELEIDTAVGTVSAPMCRPATSGIAALASTKDTDQVQAAEAALCEHLDARGHRCRMLAAPNGELCAHHAQRLSRSTPANHVLTVELLSSIARFAK